MATKKAEVIEIRPVEMRTTELTIVGDSPLVVHRWSFKALMELFKFDTGLKKKLPRNPVAEVASALYWMDEDKDPFPRLPFTMMSDGKERYRELLDKYVAYTEADFIRDATGARFGFPATAIKKAGISTVYRNEMSKDKVSLMGAFFIDGCGEEQLVEIKSSSIPSIRQDNVKVGMGTADIRYRPQFNEWSGIGEWRIEKGGQYGQFHVKTAD